MQTANDPPKKWNDNDDVDDDSQAKTKLLAICIYILLRHWDGEIFTARTIHPQPLSGCLWLFAAKIVVGAGGFCILQLFIFWYAACLPSHSTHCTTIFFFHALGWVNSVFAKWHIIFGFLRKFSSWDHSSRSNFDLTWIRFDAFWPQSCPNVWLGHATIFIWRPTLLGELPGYT